MESKTTAKDFFLHLGSIVGLYASAISFITLIFRVIDKAYPEITSYYYSSPNISFPVATLIIFFPIFLLLSWLNEKSYSADPSKKQIGIRRWLTYITLFITGIILAGDLVYVLYKFLDGQNLTAAFSLKALVVLLVAGDVFGFYIQDIREKVSPKSKKLWAIITLVIVLISIILGFSIIGSPATQRLIRYDESKITDLQSINNLVVNYYQEKGKLPLELKDIVGDSYATLPIDNQTQTPYEYILVGQSSNAYQLCATFNRSSDANQDNRAGITAKNITAISTPYPDLYPVISWAHPAGHYCFNLSVNPKLSPLYKNQ